MSKKKLQEKVQELVSLREMAAELADEISTLEDEIKADMERQGVDTLEAGKHTVRWAVVKPIGLVPRHSGKPIPAFTTSTPNPQRLGGLQWHDDAERRA